MNGMKNLFVIILIISLLMADFIILGQGIAFAIYDQLETQDEVTNVKNVEFDAYFLNNGQKVHQKECNLDLEDILILKVSVKEKGLLNDAKIKIDDANFELIKDKVSNDNVKNINVDTNEIELNQIIYQNSVSIEIPIRFKKQETFTDDYFEKESKISISGTYKDTIDQSVYSQIKTKMIWSAKTDVALNESVEKYIDLGENGILLQQNVRTEVIDNKLPRENESLELQFPILDNQVPEEVAVLLNGEKVADENVIYNKEEKNLKIIKESREIWGSKYNEYKIIYRYGENVTFSEKTIDLKAKVNTKLYTCDNIEKEDKKTIKIDKTGSVVSIKKTTTDSIYKGYMYANSSNETTFQEYNYLEISDTASVESIEVKQQEVFEDSKENKFQTGNNTVYKATAINKENFIKILGTDGEILVEDEAGNILNTINKDIQADEKGNLIVFYDTEINTIKLVTSKPVNVGKLIIAHKRAIKGSTGYTKEQLKNFSKLLINTKAETNISEEIVSSEINLNDTKTEANLEISNNNLSTLQSNENIQLLVTLKSNSAQYDLYKNPNIEIVFPKELKIKVKKITQLNNQEELNITNQKTYLNNNGQQVINMKLQGEQTTFGNDVNEGVQIAIIADISIDKSTPTMADKIVMNYTNENRAGEGFVSYADININSKYGVLVVNKLSGYNQNQDVIENFNSKVETAQLDEDLEEKEAKEEVSIINNYEYAITNISIIGKLPDAGEEKIEDEVVKTTFATNLKKLIEVEGATAKIYYSEDKNATKDSNTWSEQIQDIADIRAFKIELEKNKMEPQKVIKLTYGLKIPEGLKNNEVAYAGLSLEYDYAGDTKSIDSGILLKTESIKNNKLSILALSSELSNLPQGMDIELRAESAGENLQEGQDVYEGQKIKYIMKIINNSNESIKNINIEATHENAIFWDHVEDSVTSSVTGEVVAVTKYKENSELTNKVIKIENLVAGESIEVEYQISVKEIESENQNISGILKINAEGIDEQTINIIPNKIKQGSVKLTLGEGFWEQTKVYSNGGYPIELEVKNISDAALQNVVVELPLPEEVYFTLDQFAESDNIKFVEYKDKVVTFKIEQIPQGETATIYTQLIAEKISTQKSEVNVSLSFNAKVYNEAYYSNETGRRLYQSETDISAIQTSDRDDEYVENEDKITFTTTIENKGAISKSIDVSDDVPLGAVIKDAYILVDGKKEEVNIMEKYNSVYFNRKILENQTITLVICTEINTEYILENSITNYVVITGNQVNKKTNEITYKIKTNEDNPGTEPGEPGDNPDEPGDNPSKPDNEEVFSIDGIAWIDDNKNGYKETSEETLKDIEVVLIDEATGNVATDKNGTKLSANTGEDGSYKFKNLNKGSYLVIFKYDNGKYRVTEYQREGAPDDSNSDVITKNVTLEGTEQKVAITKTIKLEDKDLKNIDAGFIQNEKFDLRLDKHIGKIIIQNSKGTTVKQYENTQLAKVELDSKQIDNSTVIIEYDIRVTNEGELAGYVNEIVDYMPSDLSFSSEMNKNWYQMNNGQLYTKELTDKIINPGESKTVTLTLIKSMKQNNTGTTINTAEINKASNDFLILDRDSTPGNKVTGEDDISTAQVIISIRTGKVITYMLIVFLITAIIGLNVYLIKKKVVVTEGKTNKKGG